MPYNENSCPQIKIPKFERSQYWDSNDTDHKRIIGCCNGKLISQFMCGIY